MMNTTKAIGLLFVLLLLGPTVLSQSKTLNVGASHLEIKGTSNLHDWELKAEDMFGEVMVVFDNDLVIFFSKLTLIVPVENLKSGKRGLDGNVYKALDSRRHPNIRYELMEIDNVVRQENGNFTMRSIGNLTVMETTQNIDIMFNVSVEESTIEICGSYTLRLTDYGVEPPTAVFGTIRTAEDVTIVFRLKYD